jgi:glycosyltransferase involved in cell wall biosynthesis
MKRLLIINRDQTDSGGQEVIAQNIADGLTDRLEVSILTSKSDKKFGRINDSVKVVELKPIKLLDDKIFFNLFKILKTINNSDVILINNPYNFLGMASLLLNFRRKPVVSSFHGKMMSDSKLKRIFNGIRKYFYMNIACLFSNKLVFVVDEDIEYFMHYAKVNKNIPQVVINNGVDVNAFKVNSLLKSNELINVLFVGVHTVMKGTHDLMQVAKKFVGSNYHFNFIGRADEEFQAELAKLNNCSYKGLLPKEEVIKEMQKADIFTLPSYSECMPVTILEAMSTELPIVTSDIYGISRIFRGEEGNILIKPGNIDELYNAFESLFSKEKREKISKENRKTVEQRYSMKVMLDKYYQVFDEK